jgi:hypothetical protein
MKNDYEYVDDRLWINSLRKSIIWLKDLPEVAAEEIAALPWDSCPFRIRNWCNDVPSSWYKMVLEA